MKRKYLLPLFFLLFSFLNSYGQKQKALQKAIDTSFINYVELKLSTLKADSTKAKSILIKLFQKAIKGQIPAYTGYNGNKKADEETLRLIGSKTTTKDYIPDPIYNPDYVIEKDTFVGFDYERISWCLSKQIVIFKNGKFSAESIAIAPGYLTDNTDLKSTEILFWFKKEDIEKVLSLEDSKWLFERLSR